MASRAALLAWLLLLSAAGRIWGRRVTPSASAVARASSSWNHRPSSPASSAAADGHRRNTAAFVPSATPVNGEPAGRRLAFLSRLLRPPATARQRGPPSRTNFVPNRHRVQLSMSKEGDGSSSNEMDDECSLQKLYEQVQQEDSEWYYQTFSKLLDEAEPEVPPCEGGETREDATGVASGEGGGDVNEEEEEKGGGGMEVESSVSDGPPRVMQNEEEAPEEPPHETNGEERTSLEDVISAEAKSPTAEELRPSAENDEEKAPIMQQRQRPATKKSGGETSEAGQRTVLSSERTDGDVDGERSSAAQRKRERPYDEDASDDEDEETEDVPPQRPQRSPPAENTQAPPASSSPKIVRLRNTYTDEIEPLASLSQLSKLGYTERELAVLRPQVLELIVEDGIPRPDKGLPKRWVRLSRVEGYEDEADDEEDEDADWEVEVVAREASAKKAKERAPGEDRREAEDEPPESVARKDDSFDARVSGGSPNASSWTALRPSTEEELGKDEEGSSEGAESGGTFASSRVPDEKRSETTSRDENDGARKRFQRPTKDEQSDMSGRRRYDDKRGDDYDGQRPAPRRRQREYDDYDESPRRTQRSRGGEPRRRRRRPSGQRRELLVDSGNYSDDAEPPPNKFWMDLPTFRDFLRKEAQLRLKILGPDWKESVLDESRWRYDLYKTWLTMLDEGVGENPLYEYGDRPMRQGERRRVTRSRSEREYEGQRAQRGRPKRDLNDEADEEEYDRQNRRNKSGEQTRRRPANDYGRQPPPPSPRRSRAMNFNDLEESLMRPQRDYRYEPSMEDDGFEYPDDEREYAPRRRRRTPERRMTYDEPAEEEYDELPPEEVSPRRRRTGKDRSRQREEEASFDDDFDEAQNEDDDDTPQPKPRRRRRSA